MDRQRSVNVPSSILADGGDGGPEEDETKTFLFQYLSRRAQNDQEISSSSVEVIQTHSEQVIHGAVGTDSTDAATNVACRLADLGDEIDAQYEEQIKEIIELSGTPETAFSIFSEVVRKLFEWDSPQGTKINIGRIAVLMAYCYHLVKTFVTEKMASSSIIFSFMCMVAGWLFKAFIKAKFYEWLHNQGGWGQLLASASNGFNIGRNVYLLVGLASLTIWAISYFRGT